MKLMKDSIFTRSKLRSRSKSKYLTKWSNMLYSLETKLFTEVHTKTVLEVERDIVKKKLDVVKMENQQMSRDISRNKMFNKKDEDRKEKKDMQDKIKREIRELNLEIEQ